MGAVIHICHAMGCERTVPPRYLMCRRHWFMVPKSLRKLIWQTYRPGQETDKRPSKVYLEYAKQAITMVAVFEEEKRKKRERRC